MNLFSVTNWFIWFIFLLYSSNTKQSVMKEVCMGEEAAAGVVIVDSVVAVEEVEYDCWGDGGVAVIIVVAGVVNLLSEWL